MQTMKIGLIQMGLKASTDQPPAQIRDAMNEAHLPMIEQAAEQGVQVLCFQEVFNQPYFCPSQDEKWYAAAEKVPEGPTCQLMQKLAAKHRMVIIVPIYEETETGVYYNTAAVFDADGSYLGKYHKTHIPQVAGFWEKYFFKPGKSDWPVFDTAYGKIGVYICYDRHFPEGWRALALNGAEVIFNPSATVAGLSQYLWELEQPASAAATAVSSRPSTGWAPRPPGISGTSTAPATSSTRAARSRPRPAPPRTSCWYTRSTWTQCARRATTGSSSAIAAPTPIPA